MVTKNNIFSVYAILCKFYLQNRFVKHKKIFSQAYIESQKNCVTGTEKNLVYKLITTEYPNFAGLLKRKIPESCC